MALQRYLDPFSAFFRSGIFFMEMLFRFGLSNLFLLLLFFLSEKKTDPGNLKAYSVNLLRLNKEDYDSFVPQASRYKLFDKQKNGVKN